MFTRARFVRLLACFETTPARHARVAMLAIVLALASIAHAQEGEQLIKPKLEFTPAPIIGASSDLGVGGGVLGSLSLRAPGAKPYAWRIEVASLIMFKVAAGTLQVPYIDNYVDLKLPHLLSGRFKLQVRVAYTNESAIKYYGIGNQSQLPRGRSLNEPYYTYSWQHPGSTAKLSERLIGPLWLVFSLGYTYNVLGVRADTKLDEDRNSTNRFVADRTSSISSHSDLTLGYAMAIDTRDDDVSPTRGQYHTLRLALSPGGAPGMSGAFARLNVSARVYIPLNDDGMLIAARIVSDQLFGEPPLYELARYDDIGMLGTGALGGPNGVRGIPAQRYQGMWKVFGNLELRTYVVKFRLLSQDNRFGFVVFADTGRVWSGYHSLPELDGKALGLKYSLGAGLRILGGRTFVLRFDAAWSPDARPIGAYLAAGDAF